MKRIIIDIGHGRDTFPPSKGIYLMNTGLTGSQTEKWFEEHDFNSKVGILVRDKLKSYDVEMLFTQMPNADDVPLRDRVNMVKKLHKEYPIDLLISVHANAHYPNSPATGFESFYWQGDKEGKRFCQIWNEEMRLLTGLKDRGIKVSNKYKNSWYIVRYSPCTAVLLEHFFYTNYAELMKWNSDHGVGVMANVLLHTIIEYFELTKREDKLIVDIRGKKHEFDYVVLNEQNYIPIRQIGEKLGYVVNWDGVNKKVILS